MSRRNRNRTATEAPEAQAAEAAAPATAPATEADLFAGATAPERMDRTARTRRTGAPRRTGPVHQFVAALADHIDATGRPALLGAAVAAWIAAGKAPSLQGRTPAATLEAQARPLLAEAGIVPLARGIVGRAGMPAPEGAAPYVPHAERRSRTA